MGDIPICDRCGSPMELSSNGAVLCARCVARSLEQLDSDDATHEASIGQLPRRFGAYELLEEIGRGGAGVVYRARQLALNRPVAVKLLLAGAYSSEAMLRRFRLEAAAAASLHHPNIVPIHDYGECEGQPFYAMDLIAGLDLAEVCRGRPLEPRRAARLLATLARAVQHAHDAGIVHRDLKPSNVVIDADGDPHITDFGLAKRLDSRDGVTVTGQMVGSPSYVAPEQAAGRGEHVGVSCDIYGLGALLYHLGTGRAPFNAATTVETLRLVLDTDPPAPRLLNPGLPRDLETICLACLAKEPARRYPTAGSLADDCTRFLEQRPIHARPPSVAYRVAKMVRRHRFGCVAIAMVLALAAAGLVVHVRAARAEAIAQQRRAQIEAIFARALRVADPGYSRGRQATLKDLLDDAARWVSVEFGDDPRLEAGIHARIGETYCKLSFFESAVPHLEAAWAARQRLLPEDDPDYLASLRDLGVLRLWQQRYGEADEHLGRVLASEERLFGRDSEPALRTRNELIFGRELRLTLRSSIPEDQVEHFSDEHERLAQESYDLALRRWGDEHPLTLLHARNLGRALLRGRLPSLDAPLDTTGRAERAERLLTHSYETSVRVHGAEHPNTIEAMADLGRVLLTLQRHDEALHCLETCVPLAESVLGRDQLVTAIAMQFLETARRSVGRSDEANALVPRYLDAWLRTYGPENAFGQRFAVWRLHGLSVTYGQPDMAARFALEHLAEYRDQLRLPADRPVIGAMLVALADARLAQDRLDEARQHLAAADAIFEKQALNFPPLWPIRMNLGNRCRELGRFDAAEFEILRTHQHFAERGSVNPEARRMVRTIESVLVELYAAWGRPAERAAWQEKLDAHDRADAATDATGGGARATSPP